MTNFHLHYLFQTYLALDGKMQEAIYLLDWKTAETVKKTCSCLPRSAVFTQQFRLAQDRQYPQNHRVERIGRQLKKIMGVNPYSGLNLFSTSLKGLPPLVSSNISQDGKHKVGIHSKLCKDFETLPLCMRPK